MVNTSLVDVLYDLLFCSGIISSVDQYSRTGDGLIGEGTSSYN